VVMTHNDSCLLAGGDYTLAGAPLTALGTLKRSDVPIDCASGPRPRKAGKAGRQDSRDLYGCLPELRKGYQRGLWYPAGKRRLPFAGEARSHKKCFVEALAGQFGVNAVKTSILRHDRE